MKRPHRTLNSVVDWAVVREGTVPSCRPRKPVLLGGLLFGLAVACGRTQPDTYTTTGPVNRVLDASPEAGTDAHDAASSSCRVNADCDDDSVCIHHECTFFGECTLDAHCAGQQHCESNRCVGEIGPPGGPGGPLGPAPACQINADCDEHFYCVQGGCYHGIECLKHAHCKPEHACLATTCVSAI
ncbi:MAG TPA: hypothetical protein VHM70_11570 [Polyangiaceae bacterium]|nr:hypothetical protein [Polyangiaceae bacterium]